MSLPNPAMDFDALDVLTAVELDQLAANDQALAAGTGLNDGSITPAKIVAGTGSSWAWTNWTPTVTLNGGGSNGNATITGKSIQIGKTVSFTVKYVIGTTTSFSGLTGIFVSLPTTAGVTFGDTASGNWISGVAIIAGVNYLLGCLVNSTTQINIVAQSAASAYTTATSITGVIPGTWGTGSSFFISGTYEAA